MELTTELKSDIKEILNKAKKEHKSPIIQVLGIRSSGKSQFVFEKLIPFLYHGMKHTPTILEGASMYRFKTFFHELIDSYRISGYGVIIIVTQIPIKIDPEIEMTITVKR